MGNPDRVFIHAIAIYRPVALGVIYGELLWSLTICNNYFLNLMTLLGWGQKTLLIFNFSIRQLTDS